MRVMRPRTMEARLASPPASATARSKASAWSGWMSMKKKLGACY